MPYETVTVPSESQFRVKHKELGFAEIHLQIAPAQSRAVQLKSEVSSTEVPEQFLLACLEGIRESIDAGIIVGHPIEYLEVTLIDAKNYSQHSTVEAFELAGREGFKNVFLNAGPIVVDDEMPC
jgi:elongation factor G